MPPVRVKYVASFSSQAPGSTVEDLVKGRGSWLSDPNDRSGRLQADIQLERATTISYIDLGNAGSVMVSVEVGRSSWPSSKALVSLLPTVALMTPADWRAGKNLRTVRMFKKEDLDTAAINDKWDRVRIICTQPFRKDKQFGLALFSLYTNDEEYSKSTKVGLKCDLLAARELDKQRSELMSRMNLPSVHKKIISPNIGWLENKVLTKGEEENASNPFTSPVSRGARLLSLASKPTTKDTATSLKADLECEALEFLISLNLSIADINSIKVSGVRQQFEQLRKKVLNHNEKMIFKDIALDYAKNRLESLEKKPEKPESSKQQKVKQRNNQEMGKENKHMGHEIINPEKVSGNNSTSEKVKQGKFTFRKIESPGISWTLLKKTPGKTTVQSSKRDQPSKITLGIPPNELALTDCKVTTPKRNSRGQPKKSASSQDENQLSPDNRATPKQKRRKGSLNSQDFDSDLSNVVSNLKYNESDDDCDEQRGGGFMNDITPRMGKSLGKSPADRYRVAARKKSEGNSFDGHRPSTSVNSDVMIECPLCSNFYPASKIETHAASCGNVLLSSGSESEEDNGSHNRWEGSMEECPICGDIFRRSALQEHAAECADSVYN